MEGRRKAWSRSAPPDPHSALNKQTAIPTRRSFGTTYSVRAYAGARSSRRYEYRNETGTSTLLGVRSRTRCAPITSATVTLTSVGTPALTQQIGTQSVPIGLYTLNIAGRSYAALSIDFQATVPVSAPWIADITTLDNSDLSNTYHPGSAAPYLEAAYLLNQIDTPGLSDQDRTAFQDAAWAIFAPSVVDGVMTATPSGYLADAVRYGSGMMGPQFAVVSSIDPVRNRQQEFLISTAVVTPEPATLALMGAGLCIAGVAIRSRQKRTI